MLCFDMQEGCEVFIGENIRIKAYLRGGKLRLAFDAPREINIRLKKPGRNQEGDYGGEETTEKSVRRS